MHTTIYYLSKLLPSIKTLHRVFCFEQVVHICLLILFVLWYNCGVKEYLYNLTQDQKEDFIEILTTLTEGGVINEVTFSYIEDIIDKSGDLSF